MTAPTARPRTPKAKRSTFAAWSAVVTVPMILTACEPSPTGLLAPEAHQPSFHTAGADTPYTVTLLPFPTDRKYDPVALNNHRQIVVFGDVDDPMFNRWAPIVWDAGSERILDIPDGFDRSEPFAINDLGHVFGVSSSGGGAALTGWKSPNPPALLSFDLHGWTVVDMNGSANAILRRWSDGALAVWIDGNAPHVLLDHLGGTAVHTARLNEKGDVIGQSAGPLSEYTGSLWTKGGSKAEYIDLPGATKEAGPWVVGHNIHGQVLLHHWDRFRIGGDSDASVWEGGQQTFLPRPDGVLSLVPLAINDRGDVLGQIVAEDDHLKKGTSRPAALWTRDAAPAPGQTDPGSDVTVTPTDQTTGEPAPVGITFSDVVEGGETTVESGTVGQDGGPPPPSGFRLGEPPTYFDIQTTAVFSGPITICIDYSGVSYGNENVLRLLHGEADGTWVDVTSSVDPATKTICGTVESLSPFLVAETNLPPVVTALALPADPMPVGSPVAVTFAYSDGNPGDTHTAVVDWGEAMTGATLDPVAGTGSASHAYAAPGVYVVTVTVSDGELDGSRSSSTEIPGYIVVYDPSAGFVTGGGWIHSPAGACHLTEACADQLGRANFGFTARYRRGASTPDGQTQFQFKAGNLNFHGADYEWLVVAGARAQFKGTGRINGAGDYGFLLTAIDGDQSGGGGMDRFRIKIWDRATDQVVYDNQMGEDETSDVATALGGGRIVIHP